MLHVGPAPPPIDGGIAAYLEGLMRSPLASRFDLRLYDVRVPANLRRWRLARPLLSVRFALGLALRVLVTRPDLVHIHTSDYSSFWEKSFLGRLSRTLGSPYLLHLHGGSFDQFLNGLTQPQARLARRSFAGACRVVVLSRAWRGLVARFAGSARLDVLPNAVHVADFDLARRDRSHAVAAQPVRLLFIGMISSRKGLDELLQALLELSARGITSFRLDVVGAEEVYGERRRYEQLYAASELGDRVQFHGALFGAAKLSLLRQADLFVLPSRSESFGIANLEAMASGLPVVSTRTGAIPEYVEDGVQGLLVEPRDAPALRHALQRLIEDGPLRARLGAAALTRAQQYDWNVVSEAVGAIYERALAPGGRPPARPNAAIKEPLRS